MSSHYIDAIYAVSLDGESAYLELQKASGLGDEQLSCINRQSTNMLLDAGGASNCISDDGKRERYIAIRGFDNSMRYACVSAAYIPGGMTKYKTTRTTPMKLLKDARAAYNNAVPLEESGIFTGDIRVDMDATNWKSLQDSPAWPLVESLGAKGIILFEDRPYYGSTRKEIAMSWSNADTLSVNAYILLHRAMAEAIGFNKGLPSIRTGRTQEIETSLQSALRQRKCA